MAAKKKFYRIPPGIAGMTDEDIEAWAKRVYSDFVRGEVTEIANSTEIPIETKDGGKK